MKLSFSFSLSKVSCCLSKDIFFSLYLSTSSLYVFGADNNSSSKSFDSNDIGRICSCLITLWKKEISKVLINSSNYFRNAVFATKYISKSTSSLSESHAAIDSNQKLLSASIIQLHSTILFNNIWMTRYLYWNIIVCRTNYSFETRPIG